MGDATEGRVDEEICRRDLPITVGRKPRRFWSVRPLVTLPHGPGLSHSLPADNYYTGVPLDWVIHEHGYWRPIRVGRGSEMAPLLHVGCQLAYCRQSEELRVAAY